MTTSAHLRSIKEGTQNVYERQAETWDKQRVRVFYEQPWLDRFLEAIPDEGPIADLGCGSGDPITAYFLEKHRDVVAVDFAEPMLKMVRERYSKARAVLQDMTMLTLPEPAAGIISWDGFFHLDQDEQRKALPRFAEQLLPKGVILLTVGDRDSEVTGTVGGESVYHSSLSPDEYRALFTTLGFSVELKLQDRGIEDRSVIFAQKLG